MRDLNLMIDFEGRKQQKKSKIKGGRSWRNQSVVSFVDEYVCIYTHIYVFIIYRYTCVCVNRVGQFLWRRANKEDEESSV